MDLQLIEAGAQEGVELINGKLFWIDNRGNHIRDELVRPTDKLEDQTVRKIIKFARDLSAQVSRFRLHTMADLTALDDLMAEKYGFVKLGNKGKGNRTYMTFDGLYKVSVQVAEFMDYGAELQVAKGLVDQCLTEWSSDSGPEIQTIITEAFKTDQEGKVSRTAILKLLRYEIKDERWQRAMDAIRAAERPRNSKEYIRFAFRETCDAEWTSITIDMAKA